MCVYKRVFVCVQFVNCVNFKTLSVWYVLKDMLFSFSAVSCAGRLEVEKEVTCLKELP